MVKKSPGICGYGEREDVFLHLLEGEGKSSSFLPRRSLYRQKAESPRASFPSASSLIPLSFGLPDVTVAVSSLSCLDMWQALTSTLIVNRTGNN